MAQIVAPISDVDLGSWTEGAGDADASAFDELDEGIASADDTTTYWVSELRPDTNIITRMDSMTDPTVHTGHVARTRNAKSASGGGQVDVEVKIYENGTLRATSTTFTDVSNTWTTRTLTMSGPQASAITDYTLLEVSTDPIWVGGGAGRNLYETCHEFEVPDAAAGASEPPRRRPLVFFNR